MVEYDPVTDTATTIIGILPTARHGTSAVWNGSHAYVFGGHDGSYLNQIVRIDRNAAPVCNDATPTPHSLWPPNHKFATVGLLGVSDADGDTVTVRVTSVHQDELVDAVSDGSRGADAKRLGDASVDVRAERAGDGNGRVYQIGFEASDGRGGSCSGVVHVEVPLSAGRNAIDDGPAHVSTSP